MSIIGNYLYGWDKLEGIVLGCIATGRNILLLGRHGCGKSSLMRFVAEAMSNGEQFQMTKYAMDKENLISMVGIPNGKALAEGRIEYAAHQRSVFNADAILLDEITRAPKDNQNLVLEMLEEKTVFGMPLKYKFCIATANDSTYKGAMKLDEALYDRFWAVVRIPTVGNSNFGPEEFQSIMELNLVEREENLEASNAELREAVYTIRQELVDIWTKVDDKGQPYVRNNIIEFCSKFLARVDGQMKKDNKKNKTEARELSFRQIAEQFPLLIASVGAYYRVVKGDPEYLQTAALDCVKYAIALKYMMDMKDLLPIFENLKSLLTDGDVLIAKVRVGLSEGGLKSKVDCLQKNARIVGERLAMDERIKLLGDLVQEVELDEPETVKELVRMRNVLKRTKVCDPCLGEAEIKLVAYGLRTRLCKDVMKW